MADEPTATRRHLHADERGWVIGLLAAMIVMLATIAVLGLSWAKSGRNFTTDLRAAGSASERAG